MPKSYPKTCVVCGASFTAFNLSAMYCTRRCKSEACNRLELTKERNRKRRLMRNAMGLCVCGNPSKQGVLNCSECLEKVRLYRLRRKSTITPEQIEARRARERIRFRERFREMRIKGIRRMPTEQDRIKARIRKKIWYESNKELVMAETKKWQLANKEKVKLKAQRHRARKLNAQGSHTIEEWRQVLEAFGHQCRMCGTRENITKDHVVPLSRGGSDYATNLQPLCRRCNSSKNNRISPTFLNHDHAGSTDTPSRIF